MSEDELIELGFEKQIEPVEEDIENSFYYYTYDIVDGFEFISNASDELKEDEWFVHIFQTNPKIEFTDVTEVRQLIDLISKRVKIK